jgi:hypothetical protein
MFGSKKKKAEKEAIRTAAISERQEALAAFEQRAADIASITDMGEKLFALDHLSADLQQRMSREERQLETDAGRKTCNRLVFGSGSLVLGGALTGLVGTIAAPVILPAAICVTACGMGSFFAGALSAESLRKKIDNSVKNGRKKAGLYDDSFVVHLKELNQKAETEVQDILHNQYDAIATSKVFVDVAEAYPPIREAFAKRGLKEAKDKAAAPVVPPPPQAPRRDDQSFTL